MIHTVTQSLSETKLPSSLDNPETLGYCKSMFFYLLEQLILQELRTHSHSERTVAAAAGTTPPPEKSVLQSFIELFANESFRQTLLAVSIEFVASVFEPNQEPRLGWAVRVFKVDPVHIFRILGNISQLTEKTTRPAEFDVIFASFQREVVEEWMWCTSINNPFTKHTESASSQYIQYLATSIAPINRRLFSSELARSCATTTKPILTEQVLISRQQITHLVLRHIFLHGAKTLEKMATALKTTQVLADQMWNLFVFVVSEHVSLLFDHHLQQILFCTALSVVQENGVSLQVADAIRSYIALPNNKVPRKVLQTVTLSSGRDVTMEVFLKDVFMKTVGTFLKGMPEFFNTQVSPLPSVKNVAQSPTAAASVHPAKRPAPSSAPHTPTQKARTTDRGTSNSGNADAMFNAGVSNESGQGVTQDKMKAIEWRLKATKHTTVDEMNDAGLHCENKQGMTQGIRKAIELFQQAACLGDTDAMFNLGKCYMEGKGVSQDKRKAVMLFQQAARMGSTDAMFNLGNCYSEGKGVSQDKRKAVELYQQAAEMGNTHAMVRLGVCYMKGDGVSQDKRKAIKLYQQAADFGNTHAMVNLGQCYLRGEGVAKDKRKAIELLQQAKSLSGTDLVFTLDFCYEKGGVTQDKKKAIELYQRAADLSNTHAIVRLGDWHMKGGGVPQDKKKAFELYQQAIDLSNTHAMTNNGIYSEKGDGTAQDKSMAFDLSRRISEIDDDVMQVS